MEEKLQFVPSLKDAFAIGMKNLVPIVLSVLLWLVTVWIPYVNVGHHDSFGYVACEA